MLQLQLPVLVELRLVLEGHHAEGVPVAEGRDGAELRRGIEGGEEALTVIEGGDVARGELLDGGLSREAVLDEHGRDGDHRQAPVVQLRSELLPPLCGVLDLAAPIAGAEIARLLPVGAIGGASEGLVLEKLRLHDACEHEDLRPALQRHLRDGAEAAGHILELQARGWREESVKLPKDVGPDHTDGGEHADTAVLQLDSAAAVEILL
mmetsp:Transcript_36281/g.79197  ORF Transcript_36281/g.79197 Transcript_36281/m.79197 type:complete len:208 (+) Transcript_36281:580-1203(+)